MTNVHTSVISNHSSEAEFFSTLVEHALDSSSSIALWQLPNDCTKHIILSHEHQSLKNDISVEDLPPGFIFAPFDKDKDRLFLKADLSFSFSEGKLNEGKTFLESESIRWYTDNFKKSTHRVNRGASVERDVQAVSKNDFIEFVQKGILEIEKGIFEKVVPSRYKEIHLPENFDIVDAFRKLCDTYPNALVSFVSIPGVGNWLGASPELLVSVEDKTIFKTVALAGTKPYTNNTTIKSVAWTQKEIEEQALVERYIISCFKKIRLREYDEHGPKTVIAGNLMHLRSDFVVNMKETNFPQLGSTMLQLLHPTSAVCGTPLEPSKKFLETHEGYDREFYAGFLGPVNFNNNIAIFVNIRCLQISGNIATCYAGAGVTIDSVPEDEWNETEMKLNTLLNVIL